MKLDDIRGLATEDLEKTAEDAREELFKLRYVALSESVENTRSIREIRKRVARVKTVLRERQLAAAKQEA